MTLEAAAQLLATALLILQSVSANPSLPQSARDQAQNVAQQAITEATRAIGRSAGSAGAPSCTITSDKYNYYAGEVLVFDWTSRNAPKLEFIPNESVKYGLLFPEGFLFPSGQYRKAVDVPGFPFIALKASNERGETAVCSAMVQVH